MAKRGFVCLCCGRSCRIEKEEYETMRDNPVCEDCRSNKNTAPPNIEREETFSLLSDLVLLAQTGVQVFACQKKRQNGALQELSPQPNPPTLEDSPFPSRGEKQGATGFSQSTVKDVVLEAARMVAGASAAEELSWQHIGCLGEIYDHHKEILSRYNDCVGLYMHKINGQIMYIGRAVEYNNGGFRKRLSDYCRDSDSARKHPSGQKIYANRYRIQTYVMVVGSDREAAERTKLLEKQYVARYNPPWNDKLKED